MTFQLRRAYLFALLSAACTVPPDGEPTTHGSDGPAHQATGAFLADASPASKAVLSCVVTHAEGLFDVYAHAPEVGETFELSLDETVLEAQQFLRFANGPDWKLLSLNGSLTGTFSKTVLTDGTVLHWSEGESESTTIDVANGELTGSPAPVVWFRVVRSGNYISHARAECAGPEVPLRSSTEPVRGSTYRMPLAHHR